MPAIFYKLKVKDYIRETKDAVTIIFDIPQSLVNEFQYLPGQYLTIKVPVSEKDNRRAYSISSSPFSDNHIAVTVKKVDSGLVSVFLNENIKIGDELEVMPPMGNFTPQLDSTKKTGYVLFAGGSGISPLISILKSVLIAEPDTKVTLFYANRNISSIIFYEELKKLEVQYPNRLKIVFSLTDYDENWSGHKGRFNAINVSVLIHKFTENMFREAEHYICGPHGMMKEIESALTVLNVPKEKIRKESFTAPNANELGHDNHNQQKKNQDLKERVMKVKLYGEVHTITVRPDETMTTALQRQGGEPPFSCQIGACSTCRGRVISGEMIMDEREALTDNEIADGYVLTCQAHPITDDCFVDYD